MMTQTTQKKRKVVAAPATSRPEAFAMIWYEPFAYQRVRHTMVDGRSFPSTYNAWRGPAVIEERKRKDKGCCIVRVRLDPDAFATWCTSRGLRRDSEARAAYAHSEGKELLRRQG